MSRTRLRLRCRGAVQGVGFRPTVHRLATTTGLGGSVWNDAGGVTIEVEGVDGDARAFADLLVASLPPLARLDSIDVDELETVGSRLFEVVASQGGQPAGANVPPDSALCAACRIDIAEATNRRYRYPFTTCTDCGPRYSLVVSLPYDRPRTSMACFPLCPSCEAEYTDISDRRFHAEPVCCPECGPRLWLTDPAGAEVAEAREAIAVAAQAIDAGSIVAIKGLGGFQLACRADDPEAVLRLRVRKNRPGKPFAVMVPDLEIARKTMVLTSQDESLMSGPRAPILLGKRRESTPIASEVAPGVDDLGVQLPTTPVHVLLMQLCDAPALVMTSGNSSDEPICRGNREALSRLQGIADLWLLNDRDVVRRVDDSVARSTEAGPFLIRRARGWVPEPLPLPEATPEPLLAVGAHLQVTAAVANENQVVLTPHVGDLDSDEARLFLREAIRHLEDLLACRAGIVVADAHPDYPSRWLAEELATDRNGQLITVQHHLAHVAAAAAEHGVFPGPGETVVGLALDGTGWGPDGTAWGGEWILLNGDLTWRRVAQLQGLPLVGGEAAVREPWRVAASALALSGAEDLLKHTVMAEIVGRESIENVARLSASGRWPIASGAGRLFEACGALLGLSMTNSYEGEAAIRLESCASTCSGSDPWQEVNLDATGFELPSAALLTTAALRHTRGESTADVAAGFHGTFNHLAARITANVVASYGEPETVVAAGGCLVNRLVRTGLEKHGVILPRWVPPGDGGIAYGQAVLAATCLARGLDPDVLT